MAEIDDLRAEVASLKVQLAEARALLKQYLYGPSYSPPSHEFTQRVVAHLAAARRVQDSHE